MGLGPFYAFNKFGITQDMTRQERIDKMDEYRDKIDKQFKEISEQQVARANTFASHNLDTSGEGELISSNSNTFGALDTAEANMGKASVKISKETSSDKANKSKSNKTIKTTTKKTNDKAKDTSKATPKAKSEKTNNTTTYGPGNEPEGFWTAFEADPKPGSLGYTFVRPGNNATDQKSSNKVITNGAISASSGLTMKFKIK